MGKCFCGSHWTTARDTTRPSHLGVDRLSKNRYVHCVPTTHKLTALGFAHLFVTHIFANHDMPRHVISDRGAQWNNHFWKHLARALVVKHHMITAYHPQTDAQTERTNKTIEEVPRNYVEPSVQRDWDLGEVLHWDLKRPRCHTEAHCPSVLKRMEDLGSAPPSAPPTVLGRVGALSADDMSAVLRLHGSVNGKRCTMFLDTGAYHRHQPLKQGRATQTLRNSIWLRLGLVVCQMTR
jgi:hypothetical protein